MAFIKSCLEAAGYQVTIENGGIKARAGSQESNYRDAMALCDQAAIDSGLVQAAEPLDDEALAAQYDALMLTYECMTAHGYPVNAPPSKDVYVEGRGLDWHPYDLVAGSPDNREIESTCPADLIVLFETLAKNGTGP